MRANSKRLGFTLVEIMVVVLIISIITVITVPNFLTTRTTSARTSCLYNLRHIDEAKDQCAMANSMPSGRSTAWPDLVPTYIKRVPICPTGGVYTPGSIGSDPTCSLANIGHHL